MKRIIALLLAALMLAALLSACKKTQDAGSGGATTQEGETIVPGNAGGAATGDPGNPGAQGDGERTEAPGQKEYSSPKRIPTVRQGVTNESGDTLPEGVADIYAVDGKLLFTYVTRLEGEEETGATRDFYTLFEYDTKSGGCRAVSPEVGYIMRVGNRFLYDKAGVGLGASDYWDVPYFTNNSAWTDEKKITGDEARKRIGAPGTALIKGKEQPYTVRRNGMAVTIELPESGEVIALTLNLKNIAGKNGTDGLMIDLRGVAREKLWFSTGSFADNGALVKELYCVPIAGGTPKAIRYNGKPIVADPLGDIQDGVLYGYSIQDSRNRALVRVDLTTEKVQLLATVRDFVWRCVANDTHVLYEVPQKGGAVALEHKRIAAAPAEGE